MVESKWDVEGKGDKKAMTDLEKENGQGIGDFDRVEEME